MKGSTVFMVKTVPSEFAKSEKLKKILVPHLKQAKDEQKQPWSVIVSSPAETNPFGGEEDN